tara:strand:+ start:20 stop:247 length:228 start_codon:yes stop_codon:yes gene_type:complete
VVLVAESSREGKYAAVDNQIKPELQQSARADLSTYFLYKKKRLFVLLLLLLLLLTYWIKFLSMSQEVVDRIVLAK